MKEARAKIKSIEKARSALEKLGAKFKSTYAFTDNIYFKKDGKKDLREEFMRARSYKENNWDTKDVVFVHKKIEWSGSTKTSNVLLKEEFDTLDEAENRIQDVEKSFSYARKGWEYTLGDAHIFVEDIEGLGPSVEIEADDEKTIDDLFNKLDATERITGSMPEIMERICKKEIKCVLLDNDGVIVNSSEMFSEKLSRENDIPAEDIVPFFKDIFSPKCMIGHADLKEELTPWLTKWKWETTVDELLNYWFTSEHNVNEEVANFVRKIRSEGIKCYLVTNQEKYRTDYLKKEMGFDELFDGVFSSAELGCKKPSLEFYQKVFERIRKELDLTKDEVLYVDDEMKNVAAGNEFGFRAIHYRSFDNLQNAFSGVEEIYQTKILVRYKGKYLLLKKVRDIHDDHVDGWEVPGGRIEKDEEPIQAAVREVEEETGLSCGILTELKFLKLEKNNFRIYTHVYLAEAHSDKVVLSDEHSDFVWITYDEIDNLQNVIYKDLSKQYVQDADKIEG